MTANELYKSVLEQIQIPNIHPLHKAILEECCEKALQNEQGVTEKNILVLSVQVAFLTTNSTLQGLLKSTLEFGDQITLDYRGQQFIIPKNHPILNSID